MLHSSVRITRLLFKRMKEVLFFQRSLIEFKVWGSFWENDVTVTFTVAAQSVDIVEDAHIQLWIPKPVVGPLVTADTESSMELNRSLYTAPIDDRRFGALTTKALGPASLLGLRSAPDTLWDLMRSHPECAVLWLCTSLHLNHALFSSCGMRPTEPRPWL